ncbi:beta-1,6-N-acetylglucosaminyltransferase [Halomonas elongata]|uniref:beta-1,6-N-acetylglucosaminyltransferase n=1 Tax=Halomonas elongata TaxID=2746 RepID=UPI00255A8CA4|nr:beta-1,6-N-acetylglucosaminyltransferase [Halomonas elongata]MDL4862174.1 beta-1,6-N-acetylglucosaminyltransferase [Halomonas elongata]
MKIGFVILAHESPDKLKPLLEGLLASGRNVFLHHDAGTGMDTTEILSSLDLPSGAGNLYLADRVKVEWGEWSIVKATLNCLRKAAENQDDSDYYFLLSGSCMPVKPVRFLEESLGGEDVDYIEAVNAEENQWITQGIQEERWEKFHFFNWRSQQWRFDNSLKLQEKLGIKRKLPLSHIAHMGSQWWCLRRSTVEKILGLLDKHPKVENFYKRTWVPDELFFQTMVGNLIPKREIVAKPLTRYSFNSWGIPRVYYNDDYPELLSENRFFVRKVSHRAVDLKNKLSRLAPMAVDQYRELLKNSNTELDELRNNIKKAKELEESSWHHLCTSMENHYDFVKSIPARMIVVCGLESTRKSQVLAEFDKLNDTAVYGDLFDSEEVGKGYAGKSWMPINREDVTLAQHTWHKLLGDIAFHEPGKTIVFSLGKNALHYLEVLRWKHDVNIVLVDDDKRDGLDKPILKEFYFKSKVLHLIQNRLCEFSRVELENLRYWVEEAINKRLDVTYIVENLHRTQELVQWPSLLSDTHDHWELLKAIDSKLVIFVAENNNGLDKAKEAMKSWLSSGVHSGIFDVIPKRDNTLDWHYYLADVAHVNRGQSRHNALFAHMSGGQVELLDTLRWKHDLMVVYLGSDDEQGRLDELSFELEGSLDKAKEIISGEDPIKDRLDELMQERHCSYLTVSGQSLGSIKHDVLEFVDVLPEMEST